VIHSTADAGRCCRPLYVVDQKAQRLVIRRAHVEALRQGCTFSDLVENRFGRQDLVCNIDAVAVVIHHL